MAEMWVQERGITPHGTEPLSIALGQGDNVTSPSATTFNQPPPSNSSAPHPETTSNAFSLWIPRLSFPHPQILALCHRPRSSRDPTAQRRQTRWVVQFSPLGAREQPFSAQLVTSPRHGSGKCPHEASSTAATALPSWDLRCPAPSFPHREGLLAFHEVPHTRTSHPRGFLELGIFQVSPCP